MNSRMLVIVFSFLLLVSGGHLFAQGNSAVVPVSREGGAAERFRLLHERVQAHQGQVDLLFLGDSITQGWEGAGRSVWEKFYNSRRALNLGIGGDQTQHVLWRLENGHADGLSPRVTVIMIGTNNSSGDRNTAAEVLEGVQAVVAKVQEKMPETKILLLGIFPRAREFNDLRGKVLQVNQALQHLHDGERVFYLDFGHVFLAPDGTIPEDIMPDALHLSPKGYELWAEAMEPTLSKLLRE